MHENFLKALDQRVKVVISFYSKDDDKTITRTCAPLDFGPSQRKGKVINMGKNKYHFWDYDSDSKQHPLSLDPSVIRELSLTENKFNPSTDFDFDFTKIYWFIPRKW